jgi:hypothetical protein
MNVYAHTQVQASTRTWAHRLRTQHAVDMVVPLTHQSLQRFFDIFFFFFLFFIFSFSLTWS